MDWGRVKIDSKIGWRRGNDVQDQNQGWVDLVHLLS